MAVAMVVVIAMAAVVVAMAADVVAMAVADITAEPLIAIFERTAPFPAGPFPFGGFTWLMRYPNPTRVTGCQWELVSRGGQCPLRVKSGRSPLVRPMSALRRERLSVGKGILMFCPSVGAAMCAAC